MKKGLFKRRQQKTNTIEMRDSWNEKKKGLFKRRQQKTNTIEMRDS